MKRFRSGLVLSMLLLVVACGGTNSAGTTSVSNTAVSETTSSVVAGSNADFSGVGTRDNPAPIGEGFVFKVSTFGDADGSVWEATVTGPGGDITDEVMEGNMFNDPPVEGNIFYGIPFRLVLVEADKVPLAPIFNMTWEIFGPAGLKIYSGLNAYCGVVFDSFSDSTELFIGGAIEGTLCFSLPEQDVNAGPLLSAEPSRDRIYMATTGEVGTLSKSVYTGLVFSPDGSGDRGKITNPVSVGEGFVFKVSTFGDADGSVWEATVTGPGRDITDEVMKENMFNDPPGEGNIFYGIPFRLTLREASKEPLAALFNISWDLFGPAGLKIYSGLTTYCGVTPDSLDSMTEVFVGGSVEGLLCFSIAQPDADAGPMVSTDQNKVRLYLATK